MRLQLPLALLLTAACTTTEEAPPPPSVDDLSTDLEKDSGGFDTADEAPMFAEDATFAAADLEADAAVDDAIAADPAVVEMDRASTATPAAVAGHHVIIMWGRMPADPDAQDVRVWDGELTLSRGAMVVKRTIAFEDKTDRLLPRPSPSVIAFESRTRPRADGLALAVFDPQPATAAGLTLTYTPKDGSAAYNFNLRELANGPIVVDAGGGNKIIVASRPRLDPCDHGFLRGRWHAVGPHAGYFLGLVLDATGQPAGHVRGIYGERSTGESVMFGKFINREGGFRGLLKGTYGEGKFSARWIDRGGDHGVAHGVYIPGPTVRAGAFLGRWAETSCILPPASTGP